MNIQNLIKHKQEVQGHMPLVMGVLNITPDSFSDGGRFTEQAQLEKQVIEMVMSGVDIIDVGGESTRPGATLVGLEEELDRVLPVIEWVSDRFDIPVSIDTYKTGVMQAAVSAGAGLINDVNALQSDGAVEVAAASGVAVCLMHKKGDFATMQVEPSYVDVLSEVCGFLKSRAKCCQEAGIKSQNIILDPGFGFGKTLEHNQTLFRNLDQLRALGYPVLVGVSRKRMISELLNGEDASERVFGSVAAAVSAALKGASIVRVHDVKATVDALKVTMSLL